MVEMVEGYTEHDCCFGSSDSAALAWARRMTRCSLLITQLRGDAVDGLTLGGTLSEIFTGLQTMFLPDYPASKQRLRLADTKVFPEPIDGDGLLRAIACAEMQRQIGQDIYHPVDVLQMLCLARRSGAVQLVKGSATAVIFLNDGNIIRAEQGAAHGEKALDQILRWDAVEFAYDQSVRAPAETMRVSWDQALLLVGAAEEFPVDRLRLDSARCWKPAEALHPRAANACATTLISGHLRYFSAP